MPDIKQNETFIAKQQEPLNDAITDLVQQKKKRTRPDLSELQSPHCEPGEISRMLGQAMTISHWPAIDTNDAEQVATRIDQYHQFCFDNDIKPDMPGMALALGVSRSTLWKWENGVESDKPQAVRNTLKKGRELNEYLMSQMMQNGKINPVTGIFLLKNNHGYKDQTDVVLTPNTPLQNMDADTARHRILDALPDETE